MKHLKLLTITSLFLTMSAYADYGAIECNSSAKKIRLELEETSDVNVKSATLTVNKEIKKLSHISVNSTDYGILEITAGVGSLTGSGSRYNYNFKDLGSAKCFGVYGSKQKGPATVEVINNMGRIATINCSCEQY